MKEEMRRVLSDPHCPPSSLDYPVAHPRHALSLAAREVGDLEAYLHRLFKSVQDEVSSGLGAEAVGNDHQKERNKDDKWVADRALSCSSCAVAAKRGRGDGTCQLGASGGLRVPRTGGQTDFAVGRYRRGSRRACTVKGRSDLPR